MSDLSTTSQWIKFFKDAGLPANVAATYAIIFSDNRIQTDMLMDLSKEYLFDMGIKIMGDVIAILKYAKEYHTELVKQKMIMGSVPSAKTETVATRMLGRLTKPSSIISTSKQTSLQLNQLPRTKINKINYANTKPSVISLKRSSEINLETVNVKKVRRVLPEEEGGYKIKMPSGITERSRQILQKKQQLLSKRTVFDRLGDSAVSSTTDIEKNNKTSSSVFDRLGLNNDVSTSTVNFVKPTKITWESPTKGKSSLLKRTVFNSTTDLRASNVKQINAILSRNAAENRRNNVKIIGGGTTSRKSVLQRLGTTKEKSVESRLGRFGGNQKKTVFDRLGK